MNLLSRHEVPQTLREKTWFLKGTIFLGYLINQKKKTFNINYHPLLSNDEDDACISH